MAVLRRGPPDHALPFRIRFRLAFSTYIISVRISTGDFMESSDPTDSPSTLRLASSASVSWHRCDTTWMQSTSSGHRNILAS